MYAIVQDHQGFLWFGTQDGLDRYDGYTFTVFRHDPDDSTSISHNYVLRIFVDSSGLMWVGTGGGGLNVFDPQTNRFTRYVHRADDPTSLSDNIVYRIYRDRRGTLWVATLNGLNAMDERKGTFRHFTHDSTNVHSLPDNLVSTIFDDREGRLWIGTSRGACVYDRDKDIVTRIPGGETLINSILQDSLGAVWLIGSKAFGYDSVRHRLVPVVPEFGGSEQSILGADGTIWATTYDGLRHVDPRRHTMEVWRHNVNDPTSLSDDNLISLFRDHSGILWIGSFNGINKLNPVRRKFETYTFNPKDDQSLSSLRVRGFSEDNTGAIWVATQDGLNRFDPRTKKFLRFYGRPKMPSPLNANHFWNVLVDTFSRNLSIWAATNGPSLNHLVFRPGDLRHPSVEYFDNNRVSPSDMPDGIMVTICQRRSRDIWFGHQSNAVTVYHYGTHHFSHLGGLPDLRVNVIFEDAAGTMWVGGYTLGLHRWDPARKEFEPFFNGTSRAGTVAENSSLCITEEPAGTMWVGTYEGLLKIVDGKLVAHVTDKEGLPNNVIYGVLSDRKGNLWLSSNKGITRYTVTTGQLLNFDVNDGLQSNEFNQGAAFRARDGAMYFGGILGFNRFYPDSILDNPHIPAIVISDVRVFNKRIVPSPTERRLDRAISYAHEFRVPYSDNVLTFEFTALEFTSPTQNLYSYKMDGFDETWSVAGQRRDATYTNLDPGEYTFRVRASNNDGVWNMEGTSISLVVLPPWWMTWWFRGGAILVFLSIGPIVYYRRVTALKKQYALQREFSRRLIETQETERKRIATELHDSIGQDLLVIKNRTYMANQVKQLNPKAKEQLDHITKAVSQSLQNVRQISRNLRPYHLDRVGLTGAIKSMLDTIAQSSSITFDVHVDAIDGLLTGEGKEIEVNLYRVVQESVNNILKHSEAKSATVSIEKLDATLALRIADDGKGFDPATVHAPDSRAGLGLSGIGERVGMLGGTYTIESSPGAGTMVIVTIPLSRKTT
ncbi:MAG TPA: two-component regulator propeller domain-containing protein [Bacteroidota bacterium]|nr:two-component regulator propeller domain-containing protein [Bacteroidota bacterium]